VSTFIIDTHALVWYLDGDARLSKAAESSLDDPAATIVIPTIVLPPAISRHAARRVDRGPSRETKQDGACSPANGNRTAG